MELLHPSHGLCRLQEALDEFQGVLVSSRCADAVFTWHLIACLRETAKNLPRNSLILIHIRCSEQALPVVVMINKMDRKDALPFPDLEVHALRPRLQRSLIPLNRKDSTTPHALF